MAEEDDALGIIAMYAALSARIADGLAAVVNGTNERTIRRRLRELAAMVESETAALDDKARSWVKNELSAVYAAGGAFALSELATTGQADTDGLEPIKVAALVALLAATASSRKRAKRLARATPEQRERLLVGSVPVKDPRLRVELSRNGIGVIYKNGARHSLGEYASMAVRSTVTNAYNTAVIKTSSIFGKTEFQIRDGAKCGLVSHDSLPKAHGMIVDAETALKYPSSHPNCVRRITPFIKADPKPTEDGPKEPASRRGEQRLAARKAARQGRIAKARARIRT